MKKTFITTEKTRHGSPVAAFFLSLFWTGAGEFRYGRKSAGASLMLLRLLPFLVFPVILIAAPKANLLYPFLIGLLLSGAITILSPFQAMALTTGRKKILEDKMASLPLLIIYICINTLLSLGGVLALTLFFSIHTVSSGMISPSFQRGDRLLAAPLFSENPFPGTLILHADKEGVSPWRVITARPVTVRLHRGRFTIPGHGPVLEAPDEETAARYFPAPADKLFLESNGGLTYPVLIEPEKAGKGVNTSPRKIKIKNGSILISRDDRRKENFYRVIPYTKGNLKVMGAIVPAGLRRFPFLPWHNRSSE